MKPHVNVIIATPGRNMEAEYVKSLVNTLNYLNKQGISYVYTNQYSSSVSAAREATIVGSTYLNAFNKYPLSGEFTYDKIFWIDSDIAWEVKDFAKLLESEKDIVSGLYYNEKMTPMFSVNADDAIKEIDKILKSKKEEKIFASGFGFIAIKQGVFEKIPRPWFQTEFDIISSEDNSQSIMIPFGEDFSWCKRAKEQGFEIYLDPTVILSHYKKTLVRLDNYDDTMEIKSL